MVDLEVDLFVQCPGLIDEAGQPVQVRDRRWGQRVLDRRRGRRRCRNRRGGNRVLSRLAVASSLPSSHASEHPPAHRQFVLSECELGV